ncbi:hypothetical protein [Tepidibacter thalassicus]|uniref:Uncharacterized protein n=1 Tax=Tepidibacter thalassicus DSM 15285 TaxID=1123350 RepID=A0A1M5P1N3_9FIRM|nr:hypothetical protein [Tepidibacter thalassicus]SHG95710.1 hypothetical protein SAMN02744040_00340 [Tepidibacter thalassicus DSM 15285]
MSKNFKKYFLMIFFILAFLFSNVIVGSIVYFNNDQSNIGIVYAKSNSFSKPKTSSFSSVKKTTSSSSWNKISKSTSSGLKSGNFSNSNNSKSTNGKMKTGSFSNSKKNNNTNTIYPQDNHGDIKNADKTVKINIPYVHTNYRNSNHFSMSRLGFFEMFMYSFLTIIIIVFIIVIFKYYIR